MKLSEKFVRIATAIAEHVGEDFGLYPDMVVSDTAKHYFTTTGRIEAQGCAEPIVFAYSLWIDEEFFYFCINTSIYQCKRTLHNLLTIGEIAVFVYLVFCKHQTFNL